MTDFVITPGTLVNAIIFLITVTSFIFIVGSRAKKSVNRDDIDEAYKYIDKKWDENHRYIDKTTDELQKRCDKIENATMAGLKELREDVKDMDDKIVKIYDHLINKIK